MLSKIFAKTNKAQSVTKVASKSFLTAQVGVKNIIRTQRLMAFNSVR